MFWSGIQLPAGTAGFRRYSRNFFRYETGGRAYRIAGRYGIFWPYRPVRYEINNLACNWYTIEMILMIVLCKNDVLQNYDPPPQLVMKKLVKLCACMIGVFVEGCNLVKLYDLLV